MCTPPDCKKIDSSESKRDVTKDNYIHQNEGKNAAQFSTNVPVFIIF